MMRHDARSYLAAFVPWLWLLGLCMILGGGGAFVMSKLQTPIYRATTILIVNGNSAGDPLTSTYATTYARLVVQPIVLQQVARRVPGTSVASLTQRAQASAESNTPLIDVSVDDTNPQRAANTANNIASTFAANLQRSGLSAKYSVIVFEPAIPPTVPDSPNVFRNTAVGAVLGFAVALVIVHALFLLEASVPTSNDNASSRDKRDTSNHHHADLQLPLSAPSRGGARKRLSS
jgi:capsular polysaccharide biosynthesis protein